MTVTCVQWNHNGSLLAFGGTQKFQDGKELCCVQFYTTYGEVRGFDRGCEVAHAYSAADPIYLACAWP